MVADMAVATPARSNGQISSRSDRAFCAWSTAEVGGHRARLELLPRIREPLHAIPFRQAIGRLDRRWRAATRAVRAGSGCSCVWHVMLASSLPP